MNEIEFAYHEATEQWRAGFRAGVEASASECERLKERWLKGGAYHSISDFNACAATIRSLLNESGAREKDKT